MNKYLQKNGYIKGDGTIKCRIKENSGPWWETIFIVQDDKKKPEVEYLAGPGTHKCSFKGRTIWAQHTVGKTLITGWERIPDQQEHITLIAWGNDTTILKEFIDAAVCFSMKADEGKVGIYE